MKNLFVFMLISTALLADDNNLSPVESITIYGSGVAFNSGFPASAMSAGSGIIGQQQLQHLPIQRSGELLETIPGLIVSQHSGEGKANQYYLRGFNLDHGTDFASYVNNIPINLPSHGHGQGYTDLSFLMPELVNGIEYRKGPYRGDDGDFSAAGSARLRYGEAIDSQLNISVGRFAYRRAFGALSTTQGSWSSVLAASKTEDDGPWELTMKLRQQHVYAGAHYETERNSLAFDAMHYRGQWRASDQIPQRLVDADTLSAFGFVDGSDGGNSQRNSVAAQWQHRRDAEQWQADVYAIDYRLQLWSNFTFFQNDATAGDQFEQGDERRIYGASLRYENNNRRFPLRIGFDYRLDQIAPVALYHTQQRARLTTIRHDQVREQSVDVFIEQAWQIDTQWRLQAVLRADQVRADVLSLQTQNSGVARDQIISPRFSLSYQPNASAHYFFNAGRGFHSNDARGALTRVDPSDNQIELIPADFLVRADSVDLGARWNANSVQTALSLFQLELDSELVFIGDAGNTEATRPSRRQGIELASYWQISDTFLLDVSAALTRSRFRDRDDSGEYIIGAPDNTLGLGLSWEKAQWFSGLRWRHIGARALTENNAMRTGASDIVNFNVGYRCSDQLQIGVSLLNVLNSNDHNIAYYYASQLANELEPVNDIHAHPVEPRSLRANVSWRF